MVIVQSPWRPWTPTGSHAKEDRAHMRGGPPVMGGDAQKLEDPSSSYEGSAGAKGSGGAWDLKQSSLRSYYEPRISSREDGTMDPTKIGDMREGMVDPARIGNRRDPITDSAEISDRNRCIVMRPECSGSRRAPVESMAIVQSPWRPWTPTDSHAKEERAHMRRGPAKKRTKLKEHADGYHLGAREIRAKGTITGRRRRSSAQETGK
ncbi:uncharacterized protein UDID_17043 [Ustilago sp. UG-2017a]|nr:uncharacterized protein UDID_17043 [Ustilago sp. UG-2017a]